jgi:DNA-binding NarL/FixJ family response regulator
LADDHPNFSKIVESLLGPTFQVVGRTGDGRSLLEAAVSLNPDVIITDVSMPILDGIQAASQLNGLGCTSRIIFLTVHYDPDFVRACLATGAFGYVIKPRIAADLPFAIREALAGRIFVSPCLKPRHSA